MYNSCILGRYPGKLSNSPKWLMPSPYIPFSSKDKTRVDVYEFAPDYWETNSVVHKPLVCGSLLLQPAWTEKGSK